METASEPPEQVTFRYSFSRIAGLLISAILLVAASAFTLNSSSSSFTRKLAYFGVFFFGIGAILSIVHLFRSGRVVLTITNEGIRDHRYKTLNLVPWDAIQMASIIRERSFGLGVRLILTPAGASMIAPDKSVAGKLSQESLKSVGLYILTQELNVTASALLKIIESHLHQK